MAVTIKRPQRWDQPFGPDMTDADVGRLLTVPPIADIDSDGFPESMSLRDILRNDCRIQRYRHGDIIMRQDDYGGSAFVVLSGHVRVITAPGLPDRMLGRAEPSRRGWRSALSQLWHNHGLPEVRDTSRKKRVDLKTRDGRGGEEVRVFLDDVSKVLERNQTTRVGDGEILGEIAALGRTPRTATVFSEGESELLEIRWQGLRELRRRDPALRERIDRLYRERSLRIHLQETPLFRGLSAAQIDRLVLATLFETYGEFDWYASYKSLTDASAAQRLETEPLIAQEGHYVDGLILIRAGFARVNIKVNHGHRTLNYLRRGDHFGFEEIVHNWRHGSEMPLQRGLRALGYVDVLRVPTGVVEELVLPFLKPEDLPRDVRPRSGRHSALTPVRGGSKIDTDLLEQLVEGRYINGRSTMVIDMQRCTGCDDCIRACALTHDNNPRFIRHGARLGRFTVANACMHCFDPVCMIGCPTGAIHRETERGQVTINDDTCIGCATCASSCPYNNIRMVDIRDRNGAFILDSQSNLPIQKATKCDLCIEQMVSPACELACPHDAMKRLDMSDFESMSRWFNR